MRVAYTRGPFYLHNTHFNVQYRVLDALVSSHTGDVRVYTQATGLIKFSGLGYMTPT